MKLYEIDSQYMEYLYKADSKVLIHNSGNHQRKFIAIKVLINGYKYFVPLSSPDKRDYFNDQDGHKKVQFTRVPTRYDSTVGFLLKEYLMEIQRLNHI